MRKKHATVAVLPGQMALEFDVFRLNAEVSSPVEDTENTLDQGIRQAVGGVLDRAFDRGQSRERLADSMTKTLSRSVAKAQLDQWTALSQADRRIPVDALMALMHITADYTPLEWMAVSAQRRVLTVDEALCAEFGAMTVLDRHIKTQQRTLARRMDAGALTHIVERMSVTRREN